MPRKTQDRNAANRRERFVQEYLKNGFDATKAYLAAGYKSKANNAAAANAHKLLKEPKIAAAIEASGKKIAKRNNVKTDQVVKRLASIAFEASVGDYLKWGKNGVQIVESKNLTAVQRQNLKEISISPRGIRVKVWDPTKALELLGRYLGMFNDKVDVNMKGKVDVDKDQVRQEIKSQLGQRFKVKFV